MTRSEFERSFSLLENAFGMQNPQRRKFYFQQFEHSLSWAFYRAVRRLVDIRDDGYGFPLIAEIRTSMDEVLRQRSEADERDLDSRQFCQRCGNSGLYLTDDRTAAPCSCRAGRMKYARLMLGLLASRTEVEEYAKTKLPPAEPPVYGLQERNPLGFWEDTQEEHDAWCEKKRHEIEDIKRRRAEEPQQESPVSDELRFKEISEAAARIKFGEQFLKPTAAEIKDDDECPF